MEASPSDQEPRSWTLRVLAPLALVATAAVLIAVIAGSVGKSDSGDESSSSSTTAESGKGCQFGNPPAEKAVKNGYYVIKSGETLATVTEKTCVPQPKLEKLNPNLDPLQIPVRGCVDLVPDGCKALASG
jgi:LysM repeat protein